MSRKNRYVSMEKRIAHLAEILDIQSNEPSTEYDPYMQGLYNGLEMALATIEQREPVFRNLHKKHVFKRFIHNLKIKLNKPKISEG